MNRRSRNPRAVSGVLFVFVVWTAVVLGGGTSRAATLFVSNQGVDSSSCGGPGTPCRSIGQAIHNAGNGDLIIVGPGLYGNLDHSGFTGPGDENGPNTGCNCMVSVDKDVTIVSRDGATATILDANGATLDAVAISASGATFGGVRKGFTVTDADGNGMLISNGLTRVVVIGNRVIANSGAGLYVSDGTVSNLVSGNIALGNNDGFEVHGTQNFVTGNAASANSRDGFKLVGTASVLTGNVASDNGRYGFEVATNSSATLIRNAALANTRFGILVNSNATVTINQNDIFGNNETPVNVLGTNGLTNCGLANASSLLVTLSGNYFGAASGPGPNPADEIVNFFGSTTTNRAVATKEIRIKPLTP